MSKQARGTGGIIGSAPYWARLNNSPILRELIDEPSGTSYYSVLREAGSRADVVIGEIYRDLAENSGQIRYIPSDNRNDLAKLVRGMYDIGRITGRGSSRADSCIWALELSAMSPWSGRFRDDSAIDKAISMMQHSNRFSSREALDLVKDAAQWGISSAAGNDEEKKGFLEALAQRNGEDFLKEVYTAYQAQDGQTSYRGRCGYDIGSRSYLEYMESAVFGSQIPAVYNAAWGGGNYTRMIAELLENVSAQLERDLINATRENDYITDETANIIRGALHELERCGVHIGSLDGTINRLSWYVGGNEAKIRELQRTLNSIGIGAHLMEDGVYGEKTQEAWHSFLNELAHGAVPTLNWVDLLQTNRTGISVGSTHAGEVAGISNAFVHNGHRFIRIDNAHGGFGYFRGERKATDYPHLNFDAPRDGWDSNALYDWIRENYNHYPLSDETYNAIKDIQSVGKKVEIAGKVLLVAGIVLDALELGSAIQADLNDADGKLGRTAFSTAFSIGGSWAGAYGGSELGAYLGAATGPAAPIAIPILSIVGGMVGSYAGSAVGGWIGGKIGDWVVDITAVEK